MRFAYNLHTLDFGCARWHIATMAKSFNSHGGARSGAGRPRKDPSERRDYAVKASFTRSDYAELQQQARAQGVCVSVLVAERASQSKRVTARANAES